ncbi:MAG TPA: hypothetical protein DD808_15785 [Halieaceae bacterium]|jgi:hypothetical protein|nr:hypothetical protein [Haliea sp.]HAN67057.1 hypothetical protein [Halieaceae bacterium]MAY94065.1 hypothetical protein [Haliea sp.]MBK40188.1 hypothetical protein [Haliea sp.]MBP71919.1 hypothetical protein [Haliea sp.]|tara:strand:+ start:5089 stop:6048 length:960 start_codon:yes stop_codon:yes gene_type:complete
MAMPVYLLLVLLSCMLSVHASDAPAPESSRFYRLAERLDSSDNVARQQFADIALLELAEVLLAEAALARRQATAEGAAVPRLLGWAVAVEQYADDVLRLQRAVQASETVQLLSSPLADLGITAGSLSVMLSHPRREQQDVLEARIASAFCARNDCAGLLSVGPAQLAAAPEPIPVIPQVAQPAWSFTRDGNVCEQRGLRVEFPAPTGRAGGRLIDERTLCQQLFTELDSLALELRWQLRQGVALEWSAMVSTSLPQRTDHAVLLNSAGDTLLIALPLLHGTPGLLYVLLPWLAGEVGSAEPVTITLDAAKLGWTGAAER